MCVCVCVCVSVRVCAIVCARTRHLGAPRNPRKFRGNDAFRCI